MINHNDFLENIMPIPIWGFKLPNYGSFNTELIKFAYWLKNSSKGKKRSNFLGWQSHDYIFEEYKELLHPLIDKLDEISFGIAEEFSERTKAPLNIDSMWLNINSQYSYNAHHVHSGQLSGVYYVRVPENCGRLILVNPASRSETSRIRVKNYGLTPESGACIIFPSWLEHYVEPNENTEDRISISFNIS
jgi:uncharacterized protein (TIGR02466 family)